MGENSKGALENLNVNNVSPQDLFAETLNDKLRGTEQTLFWNGSLLEALPFEEEPIAPVNLQTEVEVLTGFVRPKIVPFVVTKNPVYNFLLRDTLFQTKQLGDLTVPIVENIPANSYYLCRQTRQGDIDVIDSFFLVKPEAIFQSAAEITQEGVQFDFQQPVAETVLEQIAEVTNPSNMTQEGVQFSFGSGTGPGANTMSANTGLAALQNKIAENASNTDFGTIDLMSSNRQETNNTSDTNQFEAVSVEEAMNTSRGQASGLGSSGTPTLGGGYGG